MAASLTSPFTSPRTSKRIVRCLALAASSLNMAHQVVIVGGGFGGLHAAQRLKDAPVQITLLDRRNFHLFQPLLYQVATGGLSPANIAAPLRTIVAHQANCDVLLGEVTGFD